MSTANQILAASASFLDDIVDLLESTTIETLIELLEEVGLGDLIHQGFVELAGLLELVHARMSALIDAIEEPLAHASALSGLLGLLAPLMTGLQQLVETSAEDLADAGLDGVMQMTQPIRDAARFGGDVLELGEGVLDMLPDPALLHELEQKSGALIDAVQEYVDATAQQQESGQQE